MTEKDVICCCLFEGKSGSQNKVMSTTRAHKSCFTLKINQIIQVILIGEKYNTGSINEPARFSNVILLINVFFTQTISDRKYREIKLTTNNLSQQNSREQFTRGERFFFSTNQKGVS